MSVRSALFTLICLAVFTSSAKQADGIDHNPVNWLLSQITLAEIKQDQVLLRDSLEKLIAIAPQNTATQCAQARYELNHDNIHSAISRYNQLMQSNDILPACAIELRQLIALNSTAKASIAHAKALAKKGEFSAASAAYQHIFNGQYPALHYQLEHLDWQAQQLTLWPAVTKQYVELRSKYPDVGQIELPFARHVLRKNATDTQALTILQQYSRAARFSHEAEEIWLNALAQMPSDEATQKQYQTYLSFYPFSRQGQQQFAQFSETLLAQQKLLADPAYQAALAGEKQLAENNLTAAERLLLKALAGRSKDSAVLRNLGLVYLKLNTPEKALHYFVQAQRYIAPGEGLMELKQLANTAKFWLYIEQAKTALAANELQKAQLKINLAKTLDIQPSARLNLQGQLHLAQSEYQQAERIFYQVLAQDGSNEVALNAILEITERDQTEHAMVNYYRSLSRTQQQIIEPQYQFSLSTKLREKAQALLSQQNLEQAQETLLYSISAVPKAPWPYYDLAVIYQQQGHTDKAIALLNQALSENNSDTNMHYVYALFLNRIGEYSQAIDVLNRLPNNKKNEATAALLLQLETTLLYSKTELAADSGNKNQTIYQLTYLESQPITPVLKAKLAQSWYKINETSRAIKLLRTALAEQPTMTSYWHVLYGQWLLQHGSGDEVQTWFNQYTLASSASEQEKLQYIKLANDYYLRFYTGSELIVKLNELDQTFNNNSYSASALIDAHVAQKNYQTATLVYQAKSQNKVTFSVQTKLQVSKAYHALAQPNQVTLLLRDIVAQSENQPDYFVQQVMSALTMINDSSTALQLAQQLLERKPNDAALNYLAGQVAQYYNQSTLAVNRYRQALSESQPLTDNQLSQKIALHNEDDPWYIKNAKNALIQYSKSNQSYLAIGLNVSNQSNTENELTTDGSLIPIEGYFALWQGHAFFKLDPIQLSAQTNYFDQQVSGSQYGQGALCIYTCSVTEITPEQRGAAIGLGWQNDQWRIDIGTTPLGFLVEDIVWGVQYKNSFNDFNWQVEVEKRPVTDSVLSYAGLLDVDGQTIWGGVRSTGITLQGSYNFTDNWGVWSATDHQYYSGENVKDNQRYRLMGGVYYQAIKNQQRELSFGVNLLHWAYQYNLSEQTYGHGGYYSPQNYLGIAFPFSYDARWGKNFIYRLHSEIGFAKSNTDASDYFANDPLLQASAQLREAQTGVSPTFAASSNSGLSYKLAASFEYKLTPQWFLGGILSIERADYYEPNSGQIYLRYYFDPVFGEPAFSVKPITPYADF